MTIDWNYIENQYHCILGELAAVDQMSTWCHQPRSVQSTNHKTKYGMADARGVVYINQAFVGTSAINLLNATIRHELAHLRVGLQQGHNSVFKAKAKQFKANFGQHLKSESDQIHAAIGFKYKLYATLVNGEKILFRRAHRKHPKYLNYKVGRFKYLTINGIKVSAFIYTD